MQEKPIPTREPDPDRQEGFARQVIPISRDLRVPVLPPPDSLAGQGKLIAPRGQFRVVGVDTFEGPFADFLVGDFTEKQIAIQAAKERAGKMAPYYVYDDKGKLLYAAGKP